jgi:hypothetical protein
MTASRASSLRLLKPPSPIAAAVMAAPATAAKTSIMAEGCYRSSLAQRIDKRFWQVVLGGDGSHRPNRPRRALKFCKISAAVSALL